MDANELAKYPLKLQEIWLQLASGGNHLFIIHESYYTIHLGLQD